MLPMVPVLCTMAPTAGSKGGTEMNRPEHYDSDLLFYFDGKPLELSLYQRLFAAMEQAFPDAR